MPNTRKKRPAEEEEEAVEGKVYEEVEDAMEEESLGDEGSMDEDNGADDDDDEEMADMASPSPIAKDMFLRSGKRKRRRSKETSGLTPPKELTARKKARKSTRKLPPPSAAADTSALSEAKETNDFVALEVDERKVPARGRQSLLLADSNALAAAQEPELSTKSAESDSQGRRLFDQQPPSMSNTSAKVAEISASTASHQTFENGESNVSQPPVAENDEPVPPVDTNASSYGVWLRVAFFFLFSLLFLQIWPICVKLSDKIIPLKEVDEPVVNATVLAPPQVIPAASILEGLKKLGIVKENIGDYILEVKGAARSLEPTLKQFSTLVASSQKKLRIRTSSLTKLEKVLQEALKEDDLEALIWEEAREGVSALGQTLIETPVIDLWNVDEPVDCNDDDDSSDDDDEEDPILDYQVLEDSASNLLLRASMTAEKIVKSKDAEANIRAWVRQQLDDALTKDEAAVAALESRNTQSVSHGGSTLEDLEDVIKTRLEVEMADGTGMFDYAARSNGARVIYGGSRGTTKSLVDSLPLYNRLMQLARLRFYGYGPEAAITPVYPQHALGQCWSFQQLTLREQMTRKRLEHDDYRHGNFGTLTISLASPVYVNKVLIEHPPATLTDHRTSAIRSFRIIGYADAMANGKGWSLGSFEYEINSDPLQEFEVATDIFGTAVPQLQSITLAIDSNWGLEYACLYRFRVLAEDEEEENE